MDETHATFPDSGRPPQGGWSRIVCELLVEDIGASLGFWCDLIGFSIAYQRSEQAFAYLELDGAQIMLCQRSGKWETAVLDRPFGRGVMFQVQVDDLDALSARLSDAGWPLYDGPRDVWRQTGNVEKGQHEIFVQDPDGYLIMLNQVIGLRTQE